MSDNNFTLGEREEQDTSKKELNGLKIDSKNENLYMNKLQIKPKKSIIIFSQSPKIDPHETIEFKLNDTENNLTEQDIIDKKIKYEADAIPELTKILETSLNEDKPLITGLVEVGKDIDKIEEEATQKNHEVKNLDDNLLNRNISSYVDKNSINEDSTDKHDTFIELSLCGNYINKPNADVTEIFRKNIVSWEVYIKDPIKILTNPNLMVRIDDQLLDWKVACPYIIALLAFNKV